MSTDGELTAEDLESIDRSLLDQTFLSQPRGFLLKPDFKRAVQKAAASPRVAALKGADGDAGRSPRIKRRGTAALLGMVKNPFKKRFFVLDGMVLRYYKNEQMTKEVRADPPHEDM